jgi:Protein of unknown function (DUF1118)
MWLSCSCGTSKDGYRKNYSQGVSLLRRLGRCLGDILFGCWRVVRHYVNVSPTISHVFAFAPYIHAAVALLCTAVQAFAPASPISRQSLVAKPLAAAATDAVLDTEVDTIGNNIAVKELLAKVEQSKLLSAVAKSGLLSKAQEAGISLSKLETILEVVADQPELLILVEASGPELLPILPTVIELAPAALPLLSAAVGIPPAALQAAGLASLIAAAGIVVIVPDDTAVAVAAQTLAVGVLGIAAPAASFIGAAVLGKLTK